MASDIDTVFSRLKTRLEAVVPDDSATALARVYTDPSIQINAADFPLAVITFDRDTPGEFHLEAMGDATSGKIRVLYGLKVYVFLSIMGPSMGEGYAKAKDWILPLGKAIAADTALAGGVFDMGDRGDANAEYRLGSFQAGLFPWVDKSLYWGVIVDLGPYEHLITTATG